jgi:3-hydroxymyristoyl/3-hydroxydecanoyl-(acyl carrier protein) dehydratase
MTAAHDIAETVRIASSHPALPGHFPGNPIVPGVVLLDRIAAALERRGTRLARIGVVKFLAPLRPDEDAVLAIARDGARVSFRIDRDGTPILRGEGELA